jgi:cyclopropane fatty-acyl-phospholipid synthase-like methyltransferase
MLDIAKVGPGDRLIDLGSGDGRIVIAAAQRGAVGLGIEIDANLVERSRASVRRLKLEDRATFVTQDLFEADFSSADVVTLYLLPDVNKRLAPKFLSTLKAGTRLCADDIIALRPATSLTPAATQTLIGSVLSRNVPAGAPFAATDIALERAS